MADYRIISSDSHVFEPADLWTSRVEAKFQDRAPHVVRREEDDTDWWVCDGVKGLSGGSGGSQAGKRFVPEERDSLTFGDKMENVRPGAYIPEEHLKDLDLDGIDADVLYPTQGLFLYSVPDSALLTALCKAYNDWLAEFCQPFPQRLKGIGMLNVDDVAESVRELERCAKLGLSGALITVYPLEERAYDSPAYEPVWAAAQDLALPLSLHIATNRSTPNSPLVQGNRFKSSQGDPAEGGQVRGDGVEGRRWRPKARRRSDVRADRGQYSHPFCAFARSPCHRTDGISVGQHYFHSDLRSDLRGRYVYRHGGLCGVQAGLVKPLLGPLGWHSFA